MFSADLSNKKNHVDLKKDEESSGAIIFNATLAEIIDGIGNFVIFNSNIYRLWSRWIALQNISIFGIQRFFVGLTVCEIIAKNKK